MVKPLLAKKGSNRLQKDSGSLTRPRLLLLLLLASAGARAQTPATYGFTQGTASYAPLVGGTVVARATAGADYSLDDANFVLAAGTIPFTFSFNNAGYNTLVISSNGYVTFGATEPAATSYTPISATTGYAGAVAALGQDLVGSATAGSLGEISYQTLGAAPNREFVVQFSNFRRYIAGIQADNINFQIRLHETSNAASLVYGPVALSGTTGAAEVGLRGASTVYSNRIATTSWLTTNAGNSSSATVAAAAGVVPAAGLTYTFTPPGACLPPTRLTAGSLSATGASVNFLAPGPAPASYTFSLAPGGGTFVPAVPTAAPVTISGLSAATTYTATMRSSCGGTASVPTSVTFTTLPGPPANDECSGAVVLTSSETGVPTSGTVASATQSRAPIVCNGYAAAGPAEDVWYQFTATGTTHTVAVVGGFDGVLEVLDGPCSSSASVGCADATGNDETLTLTTLSPGRVYRIRYYPYNASPAASTFTICVTNPPATRPTIAGFTPTSGPDGTAVVITGTYFTGTTAVDFNGTAAPGFVVSSPTRLTVPVPANALSGPISLTTPSGTATSADIFSTSNFLIGSSQTTCAGSLLDSGGALGSYQNNELLTTVLTPATPGAKAQLVFSAFGTEDGYDFLRIYDGPTTSAPLLGAFTGALNPGTLTATNATGQLTLEFYSDASGTGSGFVASISCVSPTTCRAVAALRAINITPTTADLTFTPGLGNASYVVTYTPDGGPATTLVPGPTASPVALRGLQPGTTYAVRVQPTCNVGVTAPSSNILFTTPFLTPANDECGGAIALAAAATCAPLAGTTRGATASAVGGACVGTPDDDVWYSFVASSTAQTITVTGSSSFDAVLSLRAGTCPAVQVGTCVDDSGFGGTETLAATGLAVGQTYFVRVFTFSDLAPTTAANGDFTICLTQPAPVPANDRCGNATAIACGQTLTGTTNGATTTDAPAFGAGCGTDVTSQPGVFYSFIGTGGSITASTCAGPTANGSGGDTKLFVLGGSCGAFTCVAGNDDIGAACGNLWASEVTFPSVAGARYYLYVQGYNSTLDFGLTLTCAPLPALVVSSGQQTTASGAYSTITVQSGGTLTLTGPTSATGPVQVQAGGLLATACQALTGPGSFELMAGAELRICAPTGLAATGPAGAVQLAGPRTFAPEASYTYNGTAAQVTGPGLPATVRNLTVNNAAGLALSQAVHVAEVVRLQTGDLTTNGQDLTLLSSAAGTALIDNTGGRVVGPGTMQRAIASPNPLGYRHYSTPVAQTAVSALGAPATNPAYNSAAVPGAVSPFPGIFGYDESRVGTVMSSYGPFDQGWFSPAGGSDLMLPARAYTVHTASSTLVSFTGTFNNAAQSSGGLGRGTNAHSGWQLLGNPYPSPLDWSTVTPAQSPGMDGAIYVFQSAGPYGGTYHSYQNGIGNASPLIEAGTGYFARVAAAGTPGAVNLTNANRVTTFGAQPAFGRGPTDTRPRLHLQLAGAGLRDDAFLYLQAGATAGLDARFDATKLANPSGLNLASLSGPETLAINGLPPLSGTDVVVPLLVQAPQAGSFSFEVVELANFIGATAYLRDALTGTQQVLVAGARYAFALAPAPAGIGRFSVVFRPATVTAARAGLTAAAVGLYPNPAHAGFTVLLPPLAGQREVQATLHNSLGQVVSTRTIALTTAGATAEFDTHALPPGVYVLQLRAQNQILNKRVTVE